MRLVYALARVVLSGLLLYATASRAEPSFYDFDLQAIGQTGQVSLEAYRGKPVLLSFFEPACSWCVRQLRDLAVLQQQCGAAIQVVALGVHGRKPALERVLARSGARGRLTAALASPSLLSAIGGVPATPYTLVIDADGRFETLLRGYVSLDAISIFRERCVVPQKPAK